MHRVELMTLAVWVFVVVGNATLDVSYTSRDCLHASDVRMEWIDQYPLLENLAQGARLARAAAAHCTVIHLQPVKDPCWRWAAGLHIPRTPRAAVLARWT